MTILKYFRRNKAVPETPLELGDYTPVSLGEMNALFPDRSAGRWCEACQQNGTHHTDKHNDYAQAVHDYIDSVA